MSCLLWIMLPMNMGVQMPFWHTDFISFRYLPRNGLAGLYGSSIINLWSNLHNVFHNGFYQQCTKVPFCPYPCQHVLPLIFLIIAILIGMRLYLLVVLIKSHCCATNFQNSFHLAKLKLCTALQHLATITPLPVSTSLTTLGTLDK